MELLCWCTYTLRVSTLKICPICGEFLFMWALVSVSWTFWFPTSQSTRESLKLPIKIKLNLLMRKLLTILKSPMKWWIPPIDARKRERGINFSFNLFLARFKKWLHSIQIVRLKNNCFQTLPISWFPKVKMKECRIG